MIFGCRLVPCIQELEDNGGMAALYEGLNGEHLLRACVLLLALHSRPVSAYAALKAERARCFLRYQAE